MNRCSCGAPHPVVAGGRFVGSMRDEMEPGVERLDLWNCARCGSTRALEVPLPLPTAKPLRRFDVFREDGRAVVLRVPFALVARGWVRVDELDTDEASAAASTLTPDELVQLSDDAWPAAAAALGFPSWLRPTRRAA